MKQFVFIYFFAEDREKTKRNLGDHVRYWKESNLSSYQNGPFTDKSGGMIIFSADSYETASRVIAADPLLREGTLQQFWLKEWVS